MPETWVQSLGWEDPLKKEMATHPVFLPGESHGGRSLVGYRPRDHKSRTRLSDFTFTFTVSQDLVKRIMESYQSMKEVNGNQDEDTEFYLPQFED